MKPLSIVLSGDTDCGKSTLIGRLLYDTNSVSVQTKQALKKTCKDLGRSIEFAYLLDSFQEERQEEFTLDTTQIALKVKGRQYLLIDVPGQQELLKNMLTGASFADAAILVINAEKPQEEQARRHAYILKFLGIEQVIIAINKMDRFSYDEQHFGRIKSQIGAFLKEIGLSSGYIIPLSAKEGENLLAPCLKMNWYDGPFLLGAFDSFVRKEEIYDFRFPVQDIYEIRGEKIAVGVIASGEIKKGDAVKVSSHKRKLAVKKIVAFNQTKLRAQKPLSIGLVLEKDGLTRGTIVYKGTSPRITNELEARIFCLGYIDTKTELLFKSATQAVSCRIDRIKESINTATLNVHKGAVSLKALDAASVVIVTNDMVAVERFQDLPALGRFVIEKEKQIIAVGIVG